LKAPAPLHKPCKEIKEKGPKEGDFATLGIKHFHICRTRTVQHVTNKDTTALSLNLHDARTVIARKRGLGGTCTSISQAKFFTTHVDAFVEVSRKLSRSQPQNPEPTLHATILTNAITNYCRYHIWIRAPY